MTQTSDTQGIGKWYAIYECSWHVALLFELLWPKHVNIKNMNDLQESKWMRLSAYRLV